MMFKPKNRKNSNKRRKASSLGLCVLIFCGCSIDIDITDLTLASNTIDFSKAEDFDFDDNYVELKDGKIQLKPLDLKHSGNDFNNGSHVGSYGFGVSPSFTGVPLLS